MELAIARKQQIQASKKLNQKEKEKKKPKLKQLAIEDNVEEYLIDDMSNIKLGCDLSKITP